MRKENYLHGRAPNKQKKKWEIFLGFLLILQLIKLERKNQKEARNVFGFSQSFSNTQEESKKIKLTWIIQ